MEATVANSAGGLQLIAWATIRPLWKTGRNVGFVLGALRMLARTLRQEDNQEQERAHEDDRGKRPAHGKPSLIERLVDEISDRSAERPGDDERGPEQED